MNDTPDIIMPISGQAKVKGYIQLLKFRLTFLVTFSGVMAYVLASEGSIDYLHLLTFTLGAFLVTGSANIINQVIEREYDKLMSRTLGRPLPTGVLSIKEALVFCVTIGILGLLVHWSINPLTCLLSFISLVLYGLVYTPLKRVGPIAVFVGAFPGALPPMIGWVAVTGHIDPMAILLFGVQFLWQFPHFWAIAWVAHDDYTKAGFRLLPSRGGRDQKTAYNIMLYTLFLIPASLLPFWIGATGVISAIIVAIAGVVFLLYSFILMKKRDRKAALGMMFGSFLYLPIVQIAYVLDKI